MSLVPNSGQSLTTRLSIGAWAIFAIVSGTPGPLHAQAFTRGNIVVSRSTYVGTASTVTTGQQLPPTCGTSASCPGLAIDNGSFPANGSANNVWNNDSVDGSFGVTSPIFLDQLTPTGTLLSTFTIPSTQIVTSFSSKSELALNLSADGQSLTFMGYIAPVNTLDVSNANTPGIIDPTNPVGTSFYRGVAQISANGTLQITETNAYSGNNGRAAILGSNGYYFMTGNANNGTGTPANVIDATGVEIATPGVLAPVPTMVGDFSISQVTNPSTGMPYAADKAGKDNNFRGLTIFNNTLYVTKGSGSNGINTVYQVGNAGTLPTLANASTAPITILPGFPTTLAKASTAMNPFGIWFANANTLYVADEGDGTTADAATSTNAGLQKWILNNGTWTRAYVLQNGLNLGTPYSVASYPTSLNPSTDGLRNITGRLNGDGTVTIWAVTSTVSSNGDQGADPNKLVVITDTISFNTATEAASEQFTTLETASYGNVLRGVSLAPSTLEPVSGTFTSTDYPGAAGTANTGIDHFSRIVGNYFHPNSTGFLWQQNTFSSLPDPVSPGSSEANGLNNQLMIAGEFAESGEARGLLNNNGTLSVIDFNGDPTDYATIASGVNSTGQMVGSFLDNVQLTTHGFLLFGNTFGRLDFPGATATSANGIAGGDSGSPTRVVGKYTAANGTHGFVWDVSGFGALNVPGATQTIANGVYGAVPNTTIQIVGTYKDLGGISHGFTLNQGVYENVDYPAAASTIAYGVNDAGKIVGSYIDSLGNTHGFVFVP